MWMISNPVQDEIPSASLRDPSGFSFHPRGKAVLPGKSAYSQDYDLLFSYRLYEDR
jgi:hypothetical protein